MSLLEAGRSDAELARAVAGGRPAAFADLYERYADPIHEFCVRMLGPGADAADATQETFLNVLARLVSGGRPIRDVRAYLFTSARHACARVAERRRRLSPVESVPESPAPGAETVALRHETQADVRAANATLPDRQREVLALRELGGLSYRQIGGVMELDENAAAQLAWRARAGLRSALRRGAVAGVTARTKDCERALTLLALREDRTLPREDETWLEAHLEDCDRCRVARSA
jgi:RNA polymerase sigma factor (sigma-70 family)